MTAFPKPEGRVYDEAYRKAVKQLPCCAAFLGGCAGVVEADHVGARPVGRKADDDTCIPMCVQHHRERTDHAGPFRPWTKEMLRLWTAAMVLETRAAVEKLRERGLPDWA